MRSGDLQDAAIWNITGRGSKRQAKQLRGRMGIPRFRDPAYDNEQESYDRWQPSWIWWDKRRYDTDGLGTIEKVHGKSEKGKKWKSEKEIPKRRRLSVKTRVAAEASGIKDEKEDLWEKGERGGNVQGRQGSRKRRRITGKTSSQMLGEEVDDHNVREAHIYACENR